VVEEVAGGVGTQGADGDGNRACGLRAMRTAARSGFRFEKFARQSALSDYGAERSYPQFAVVRDRDGDSAAANALLHHYVGAAAANFFKAVSGKDVTSFFAGKNAQPTHASPRDG
jgi:hypothetical protein